VQLYEDILGSSTVYVFVRDITDEIRQEIEKEKRERIIVQQSKLAEMGQMLSSIAHQWKQPLNLIGFAASELDDEDTDKKQLAYIKKTINEQILFMSQTIDDFRSFLKSTAEKQRFMPCEVIEKVKIMFRGQFEKKGVDIVVHPHEHFVFEGYQNDFLQVILNIFTNAADVFNEKKIVKGTISCFIEQSENTGIIRIRDNGGGIPEDLLPYRVFEPYFSTKGERGTGIGLEICKTIIEEKFGGKLWVHNVENGAEFVIELLIDPDQ